MALVWMDGFDRYGTSGTASDAARRWNTYGSYIPTIVTGRIDGYAVRFGNWHRLRTPHLTTNNTLIIGFAIRFPSALTDGMKVVELCDGGDTGVQIEIDGTSELRVMRGSTTLDTTSGLGLLQDTWYFLELKVVCGDGTSGSYELRINEATVLSNSACDTKEHDHSYHDNIYFYDDSKDIDDVYVLDGSSGLNSFLGNSHITCLDPTSDDSPNDWTPQAGSDHYAMVDDTSSDDDSTYVESGTSTDAELWGYSDMTAAGNVRAVQICTDARETDAQSFQVKNTAKLNSTTSEGDAISLTGVDYTHALRIMEQNPEGGAWTQSNLNSTKFGVKLV